MAERSERRLQEHGQHVGRPPVQGGRPAGTRVELGGVGKPQDRELAPQSAPHRELAPQSAPQPGAGPRVPGSGAEYAGEPPMLLPLR